MEDQKKWEDLAGVPLPEKAESEAVYRDRRLQIKDMQRLETDDMPHEVPIFIAHESFRESFFPKSKRKKYEKHGFPEIYIINTKDDSELAKIFPYFGRWYIKVFKSEKGIYLDGEELDYNPKPLKEFSKIKVGDDEFRVLYR
ncbi:MAG: hypothetical protein NTY20_06190 [Candidatus Aenigmarchaeota archaeon]|nr:hypothetical protein [Candidatus Aenigmarchaeota archaeon]